MILEWLITKDWKQSVWILFSEILDECTTPSTIICAIILIVIIKYYFNILQHINSPVGIMNKPLHSSFTSNMSSSTFSLPSTAAVASRMFSSLSSSSSSNNNININSNNSFNSYLQKDKINSNLNILNVLENTSVGQYSMVVGDSFEGDVGTVGDKFFFRVLTADRNGCRKTTGGDLVTVHIQGCDYHNLVEDVKVNVIDKNNGTHNIHYNVTKSGHYFINVFVNHVAIQGSPFKVKIEPLEYSIIIHEIDNIIAGEDFRFEILPIRSSSHTIQDKIEIETYINENGTIKKTNNDFNVYPNAEGPDGFFGRGKLIRSGDYIIEGSVYGTVVFTKNVKVNPGPVSARYTHLLWDGKELISENKLFILPNSNDEADIKLNNNAMLIQRSNSSSSELKYDPSLDSEFRFLIQTKDQFGNVTKKLPDQQSFEIQVIQSLSPISMSFLIDGTSTNNNSNIQNKTSQNQIQPHIYTTFTPTLVNDDPRGLLAKFTVSQCGWYYIIIKLQGSVITNCPFTVIAVKESDCSFLSEKYHQGYATFECQIEKNKKLSNVNLSIMPNRIDIQENYYFMNITLYEFIINPTVQITLLNENELLIKDNKNKVYLKNCNNSFLILLTTFYFFGDQTEPTFESKIKWFKSRLGRLQNGKASPLKLNITSRDNILEESITILKSIDPKELTVSRMIVKFMNEEGVDIGGISKEWFAKLSEEVGNKPLNGYHLFECFQHNHLYHVSPFSNLIPEYRVVFRTLGRLVAKSIYESIIKADRHLSIRFTPAFYKLLLGESLSIHDLEPIDPHLYRNQILFIKNTPIDQVNEILGEPLYFTRIIKYNNNNNSINQDNTLNHHIYQQHERTINLKPFGNLIRVTDENKEEYLELLVNNMLYGSVKTQIDEFKEGFFQLVPSNLISIFNWKELEVLVCGKSLVNIDDLKTHSNVTGFVSQEITDNFWSILSEFNEKNKKQLLKFVTGSSSVPLGGFYQLYPHFTINITPNTSSSRLPVSHTCFNRIDIPRGCTSYHTLKQNLLTAINEASEGFSLV